MAEPKRTKTSETPEVKREPRQPLSFIYADAKEQIFKSVRTIIGNYRLPLFMVEGILESLLSEYRHEALLELTADSVNYKLGRDEYYREILDQISAGPKKEGD